MLRNKGRDIVDFAVDYDPAGLAGSMLRYLGAVNHDGQLQGRVRYADSKRSILCEKEGNATEEGW